MFYKQRIDLTKAVVKWAGPSRDDVAVEGADLRAVTTITSNQSHALYQSGEVAIPFLDASVVYRTNQARVLGGENEQGRKVFIRIGLGRIGRKMITNTMIYN